MSLLGGTGSSCGILQQDDDNENEYKCTQPSLIHNKVCDILLCGWALNRFAAKNAVHSGAAQHYLKVWFKGTLYTNKAKKNKQKKPKKQKNPQKLEAWTWNQSWLSLHNKAVYVKIIYI